MLLLTKKVKKIKWLEMAAQKLLHPEQFQIRDLQLLQILDQVMKRLHQLRWAVKMHLRLHHQVSH